MFRRRETMKTDGSFERPFRTFARAQAAVREAKKDRELTVCVRAGEYFVKEVAFGPEDSGTPENRVVWRAYGDGNVVLNGGVSLRAEDFHPIPDEIRERLHGDAREKTLCVDLKTYGLTKADWGELSPIGMFGSEDKYDNVCREPNCELFFDGERMTLSRYPNAGENLQLDDVADVGDCFEFPAQNYYTEWNDPAATTSAAATSWTRPRRSAWRAGSVWTACGRMVASTTTGRICPRPFRSSTRRTARSSRVRVPLRRAQGRRVLLL